MTKKSNKELILKIYEKIKKLTLQQKKLIESLPDIKDLNPLSVEKLNRYISKKAELFSEISSLEGKTEKKELEIIKNEIKPFLVEIHDIEKSNICLLEQNFRALGKQLLSVSNSKKLQKAYSNNVINNKPKNEKPKFIDRQN